MYRAHDGRGGRAMIGADRNDEVVRLVGAMCNGTITADDTGQLDAVLTENEQARRFYNNYMFLHAELHSQHASLEAVESGASCELGIAGRELERAGSSSTPQTSPLSRKRVGWFAIAAALIGVAAVSSWVTYAATRGQVTTAPAVAQIPSGKAAADV